MNLQIQLGRAERFLRLRFLMEESIRLNRRRSKALLIWSKKCRLHLAMWIRQMATGSLSSPIAELTCAQDTHRF